MRQQLSELVGAFPGADYLAAGRDRVERDWTIPDRLPEIDLPTLVMAGERELPGFRSWAAEIAGRVADGRLETLAGLGHLHLLEDPARVAGLLIEHLVER